MFFINHGAATNRTHHVHVSSLIAVMIDQSPVDVLPQIVIKAHSVRLTVNTYVDPNLILAMMLSGIDIEQTDA